ncbi:MAG: hypothetical protein J7L15_02225, partial [Clostridiales bacterium]|nr:hypothetical protein [Clostridiales bacterium]
MKVTVFQSTKTAGKYPYSPTHDNKFMFETFNVDDISDVLFYLSSNFFLNIPLVKSTKHPHYRRRENLESYFVPTLEWVTIDLDEIQKMSDREICINWFREQKFEVILAESRNPLNIKGIIKVDNLTPKEAKLSLKEMQEFLPAKVDLSVCHYASYQAPILKNKILYTGSGKPLKAPKAHVPINPTNIIPIKIPTNIQDICRENFESKGFIFYPDGKCSHFTEKKTPKGFSWNNANPFKMMHWNPDRVVDIWAEVVKTKEYKEFNKDKAKNDILELMPRDPETAINKRFLGGECETVTKFLDGYKILKIQSPMGTAKSTVIDEVITQSTKRELRVLLITNRISLADDIVMKYKNIKHYQHTELEAKDAKYQIGDNLVCQVNSLWKYSLKYFDVIIIDETTSLLFQLLSLEKNTKNIITKLFATRYKKIVLADAFLFDPLVKLFGDSVISINNNYRDTAKLTLYSQVDRWAQEIISKAQQGTITVSAGSTKLLKSLELIFESQGISFFTVSSDTTRNEKELVYKEFQKNKPRWRVIMYSPTITVGISILADSVHHFHLDRGNSMDVVSSIQMIKRNRNAECIHLLLGERMKYNPTNIERIESELLNFSDEDEEGDVLGISEVGHKFAQVHKIFNTLENRHKVSFLSLLKYQFNTNKNIILNEEKITPFMSKIGKLVVKKQIKSDLDLFDEYKKMSSEEISDIEYQLFNKTKKDEKLSNFNILMNDETLNLTKQKIEMLVQEEIKTPGIIDCYKKNLIKSIVSSNNGYSFSLKSYGLFLSRGINLTEYGYTKQKNIYRLN